MSGSEGGPAVQQFFDQLVYFVQHGIAAIFRFVQFIWIWSVGQITTLLQAPWQEWPLPKQIVLIVIILVVVYVLYWAAKDLWAAGQTILTAFGTLVGVLVRTLPRVLMAGLIALGGVWLLNNLDLSRFQLPYRDRDTGSEWR
jgi:hypothetical protein